MADKPGWTQGGYPDAGKPQVHDTVPPQWTGVPIERDPVSGKLLSGDPLGRSDKGRGNTGRSLRTPGKSTLIAAAAVPVVAAAAVTVFLVTRNDENPDPAASAGGVQTSEQAPTSAATPSTTGTTTTSAAEAGPRDVPVTFTATSVTPPPGFGPDPTQGSVGDTLAFTWTLTGPCDGAGSCELVQCDDAGCGAFDPGEPQGAGYITRFSTPVTWDVPECSGGTIDNTVTWAVTGDGDETAVTGSWVQQAAQVLFTGSDGRDCAVYLTEWSIASS